VRTLRTIEEMRATCARLRADGRRIGFVPTMGALHAGHMSLVRSARAQSDVVAVSIFVNPMQFGPHEDFSKYPRTFERDSQMLDAEKVDLLFAPATDEMYPGGAKTFVEVAELSERLDGRSRPGHFRGVATVVSKLFHIVGPQRAYFGQKDAAQAAVLKRMVHDLDLDVEVVICPIVREPDGLAMSSRNVYLTPAERKQATVLYRALNRVQFLVDKGERKAAELVDAAREVFAEEPAVRIDYIEAVHPETLAPVSDVGAGALFAVAAYVGNTRLIDNTLLFGGGKATGPAMIR